MTQKRMFHATAAALSMVIVMVCAFPRAAMAVDALGAGAATADTLNGAGSASGNATITGGTVGITGATSINGATTITGATSINNNANNNTNINTGTSTGTVAIGNSANTTNLNSATNNIGANNAFATTNNIGVSSAAATTNNMGTNAAFASTNTIGNTNAGTSVKEYAGNSTLSLANNASSMTVTGGTSVIPGATGTTSGQLQIVNGTGGGTESSASLTLTNGSGHTRGLQIYENRTVISGGTNSTSLSLNDTGAHFANIASGGPAKVSGVANGVDQYDAVNFGQLREAYAGIAAATALAAVPGLGPGKRFSIGAGYGYFKDINAMAVGAKAAVTNNIMISAGVGITGVNQTYSAGLGYSW